MTSSISSTSSSHLMSSQRTYETQIANRQRPDPRNASSATSTQVKSRIRNASGIDVDAAARKVDTDGDHRLTTSELASAKSKELTTAAAKLDTDGDGKVIKGEVRAKQEKASKGRDANGDGKVTQQENIAYAALIANQLDSQYTGTRPKGFSREEVSSQLGSVNTVGSRSSVMSGYIANEYGQADKNGDGQITPTEGEDYVANKTGLSDDVKRVKAREKTEKEKQTEQDNKVEKSGNADGTTKTGQTDKSRQEKKTETSYEQSDAATARQMLLTQAYSSIYEGRRSGQLDISA